MCKIINPEREPVRRCDVCAMSFETDGEWSWHARHTPHELDCDQDGSCRCDVAVHPHCCWECNDTCGKCGGAATHVLVFEHWPVVRTCDDDFGQLLDEELAHGEQLFKILTLPRRTG